jgi:DNA-binding response OmpR family regulator
LNVDIFCVDTSLGAQVVREFCGWLQSDVERSCVPVLFLSPPAGRWAKPAALAPFRPEQDDCLPRPLHINALIERMSFMLSRAPSRAAGRPRRCLHAGSLMVDTETHEVWHGGQKVVLTPIEFRLFAYFVARPGAVISLDELLEHVWGFFPGTGAPAVVRVHIGNLKRKIAALGLSDCPLQTLPRRGYRLFPIVASG